MTQNEALDILKTGTNVFLTGPAGSGKTHILREYLAYLKKHKVPVGITASTGIAATHMGGVTIHSWAGIGIKDSLSDWDIDAISQKEKTTSKMRSVKVLVIDEISMLHHFRLDMVDRVLRYVRDDPSPFGGVQVVVCGDFFQLPPIVRHSGRSRKISLFDDTADESYFAYNAKSWHEADFAVCYLEGNRRQNDKSYAFILDSIRNAVINDEIMSQLMSRAKKDSRKENNPGTTRLYSHNIDVDAENERELAKIVGKMEVYTMTSKGKKNHVENLKASCLAPELLKLKKGAKVMFVKNNFDKGYVNGTVGTIRTCSPYEIVVEVAGSRINVEPDSWRVEDDDGRSLAEIKQYPLRLAWAITIHKSQGMSLESAEIDLSKSFEKGMGYVALSRVRSLEGLLLLGLNKRALEVNEQALKYDRFFRDNSAKWRAEFALLSKSELADKQKNFLG